MNKLKYLAGLTAIAFAAAPAAQAQQATVDMSTALCKELVAATPDEVANAVLTAVWFSGFFNGKHDRTVLDTEMLKTNADTIVQYCHDNPTITIMKAVGLLIKEQKLK